MNVIANRDRVSAIASNVHKHGGRWVELMQAAIGVLTAIVALAGILKAVETVKEEAAQPTQS